MLKKRNRARPLLSLQDRLTQFAANARNAADQLSPGPERERLVQKALSSEAAAKIERWLSSAELRNPT